MQDIPYEKMDPGVRPLARYFNEHGLPTVMSCEGHPDTTMRLFWIQFDSTVTENDIRRFMNERTQNDNGFTAQGWFVRRFENYKEGNRIEKLSCMCYVAADKKSAASDLKNWQERDRMKTSIKKFYNAAVLKGHNGYEQVLETYWEPFIKEK